MLTCAITAAAKPSWTPFPAGPIKPASSLVVPEDLDAGVLCVTEGWEPDGEDRLEGMGVVVVAGLGESTVARPLAVWLKIADVLLA